MSSMMRSAFDSTLPWCIAGPILGNHRRQATDLL
jgi:hypothetical protein